MLRNTQTPTRRTAALPIVFLPWKTGRSFEGRVLEQPGRYAVRARRKFLLPIQDFRAIQESAVKEMEYDG